MELLEKSEKKRHDTPFVIIQQKLCSFCKKLRNEFYGIDPIQNATTALHNTIHVPAIFQTHSPLSGPVSLVSPQWRSTASTYSTAPGPVSITTNGTARFPLTPYPMIKKICLACSSLYATFPSNFPPTQKRASLPTLSRTSTLCTILKRPPVFASCSQPAMILVTLMSPSVCKRFMISFTLNMLSRIHSTCTVPGSSLNFSSQSLTITSAHCHAFEYRHEYYQPLSLFRESLRAVRRITTTSANHRDGCVLYVHCSTPRKGHYYSIMSCNQSTLPISL